MPNDPMREPKIIYEKDTKMSNRRYGKSIRKVAIAMLIQAALLLMAGCGGGAGQGGSGEYPNGDSQAEDAGLYLPAGRYEVGVDIPPGEYVIFGSGYMSVSSDAAGVNIMANDIYRNMRYITVKERTYFEFGDGKAYPLESAPVADVSSGILSEGMYKAGRDIPAGEYKVSALTSGFWTVYGDSSGGSIVAIENFEEDSLVTVRDGEYLQLRGCELYLPALSGAAAGSEASSAEMLNEFLGDCKIMWAVHDEISTMIWEMGNVSIGNLQARFDALKAYRAMIAEINGRYADSNTQFANMITDTVVPLFAEFLDAADSFVRMVEAESSDLVGNAKTLENVVIVKQELVASLTALREFAGTPEALTESESAPDVGGSGAKPEGKYLVIAFDDAGIYVRATPTVRDNTNKILYIDAGNRSVRLRYLREKEVSENGETHIWYQVALPDGREGWVRDDVVVYESAAEANGAAGNSGAGGDASPGGSDAVDIVDLVDNIANYSGKYVKVGGNLIIMYKYESSEEQFFTVYLVGSEGKVHTKYHLMVDYSKYENPRAASALADENAYVALEGTIMKHPGEDGWYLEAKKITEVR
jgi:hypothetical protein